jgi:hypothetical protein
MKERSRFKFRKEIAPILLSMEQKCNMCLATTKLLVHHIDGDYKNNNLSNIAIICRGCHNRVHVRNPKGRINIGKENRHLHIGNSYRRGIKASYETRRKMTETQKERWKKRKRNKVI